MENAMQFVRWVSIVAGCDYFKWKDVGPATAWKLFDDGHIDDLVAVSYFTIHLLFPYLKNLFLDLV